MKNQKLNKQNQRTKPKEHFQQQAMINNMWKQYGSERLIRMWGMSYIYIGKDDLGFIETPNNQEILA